MRFARWSVAVVVLVVLATACASDSSTVPGSGSPGPTVGKNIGLGYLPAAMTAVGTKFLVDCRGKKIEAVVVKTPFYKRP